MRIPQQFLDELRQRTSLSQLVMRDVALKRAGREWKGCCPFHNEKTPSFYVNDEKEFYHCFGCEAHGDAIRWLTDHRGMQFIDAVKELAAAAGMEVPASDPKAAERAKARDGLIDINAQAERFFVDQLGQHGREAIEYLASRGISSEVAAKFNLGWAPRTRMNEGSALIRHLSAPRADLDRLGLVRQRPDSDVFYDFFRGRIIIPIHDGRGQTIGFGGRIVGPGEPKYLNSPDTPVFDKGRTLFNLHRAGGPARAAAALLIVEGYMDVIGLARVGIDHVVAPNGTAITEAQLQLAWRLVDSPVLMFDGDKAGRKAAVRAAEKALAELTAGKSLRFAFPPEGRDPDDIAQQEGAEGISRLTADTVSIVDVIWRALVEDEDITDPDGRARATRRIADLMKTVKDRDVYQAYRQAFIERLQGSSGRSRAARAPAPKVQRDTIAESVHAALVIGIIRFPELCSAHRLNVLPWSNDLHRAIVTEITEACEDAEDYGLAEGETLAERSRTMLDRAGLTAETERLRSSIHLRMPFLDEKDDIIAKAQLVTALRETFA